VSCEWGEVAVKKVEVRLFYNLYLKKRKKEVGLILSCSIKI
jgi:hypothetical protein